MMIKNYSAQNFHLIVNVRCSAIAVRLTNFLKNEDYLEGSGLLCRSCVRKMREEYEMEKRKMRANEKSVDL